MGIGITLAVIAVISDQWGGRQVLSFVFLAVVIALTWLALLRVTSGARNG